MFPRKDMPFDKSPFSSRPAQPYGAKQFPWIADSEKPTTAIDFDIPEFIHGIMILIFESLQASDIKHLPFLGCKAWSLDSKSILGFSIQSCDCEYITEANSRQALLTHRQEEVGRESDLENAQQLQASRLTRTLPRATSMDFQMLR
jgi:hypothetical protein